MDKIDSLETTDHDEEQMFLRDVIGDEHELLFLDSYLRDVFGSRAERVIGLGNPEEEETI
jgi:hypothetical protein